MKNFLAGPNPWKVALILEELGVPYTSQVWATEDLKKEPFTTELNPNGFVPVLVDPNTDITIWESNAIVQYLLDTYDTTHAISFGPSSPGDRALLNQWMSFQATFQSINLSLAFRFSVFQPNSDARRRFVDESLRVLRVLETDLHGKDWLVGGRCTAADLVFVAYMQTPKNLQILLGDDTPDLGREFPNVDAWLGKMRGRETAKRVAEDRARVFAQHLAKQSGTST